MTLQTGAEVHEENQLRGKDDRMTCKGKWLKTKFMVSLKSAVEATWGKSDVENSGDVENVLEKMPGNAE